MATGYEVQMYSDIKRGADALVAIAKSLDRIAGVLDPEDGENLQVTTHWCSDEYCPGR